MRSIPIVLASLLAVLLSQAQTIDSLDNFVLKIPPAWKVNKQANFTELSLFNKDRFCQVAIYQKQAATADRNASFEKEWSDLVLASFEATPAVSPKTKKTKNGQSVLSFGAPAVSRSNSAAYYVELNMYDCGNSVQSAMVISGSREHLQFFDSSWQSLITQVKITGTPVVPLSGSSFNGYWGKSSSSPHALDPGSMVTNAGYLKSQYDFRPDGTYSLRAESWGGYMRSNEYTLIDEKGSYATIDKQLVIMPSKSRLLMVDKEGKVKKTENLDISRRSYTWQLHYFEGINETNLVLKPVKDYFQDGGFSSNAQFPNAYLLSRDYKPEWKIQVK